MMVAGRALRWTSSISDCRRHGTYDDVSSAVMYLASDSAAFITGQTLILDGGRIMR